MDEKRVKYYYASIDFLKGLCIILVILTHVNLTNTQKNAILAPYWIWAAVPVFMVLGGFNYAASAARMDIKTCLEWFEPEHFLRKVWRLLIPFAVAMAIQIAYCSFTAEAGGDSELMRQILGGGNGPGSYYNAMLAQTLVVFPLLYLITVRAFAGGWIIILLNVAYEIIVSTMGLSSEFYRLCVFRYLTAIVLGIWLHKNKEQLNGSVLPWIALIGGGIYLFFVCYGGYKPLINRTWTSTSMFSAPYAFGVVLLFMKMERPIAGAKNIFCRGMCLVGKASYHIFLTQMVYFTTPISKRFFESRGLGLSIFADMIICISAGITFYLLEQYVRKCISKCRP